MSAVRVVAGAAPSLGGSRGPEGVEVDGGLRGPLRVQLQEPLEVSFGNCVCFGATACVSSLKGQYQKKSLQNLWTTKLFHQQSV